MGQGVILIRHAMPELVRGVSSRLWGLGDPGREDCVLLAHALRGAAPKLAPTVYTSDERKAEETAAVLALRLGLQVAVDARLAEVDRPTTWDDDYRAQVGRYLKGGSEPGWEPRDRVVARFAAGVAAAILTAPGQDTIIVNHGLALSLYLNSIGSIDLVPFWRALTFPDAWRVDLRTGELTHLFAAGIPPT